MRGERKITGKSNMERGIKKKINGNQKQGVIDEREREKERERKDVSL